MNVLRDTGTVMIRELRPMSRDPFAILFGMLQPLVFLGLYGPLLPEVTGGSPWQWFVPGIVVMMSLFGTSVVGSYLLYEMQTGSHERMLVTPLSRSALLVGRALKEIVPLVAQAVIIVAVAIPLGFTLYPLGALLGLLIVVLFGVGLGALSYTLALAVRTREWLFWVVQQSLIFPVMLLGGILLPLDNAPGWLYAASRLNPMTYVVEAERALFAGDLAHPSVPVGAAAALGIALVGLAVGTRAMRLAAS
jgi:ABC-2 type transport system permease protein